jgi:HK97 family phage prohead protease/HK97 family phage major capsid protein
MNKLSILCKMALSENSDDSEFITIEGYANKTIIDRHGDLIPMETWTKSSALTNFLKNPIMLFNHDWNEPIGTVSSLTVTDEGLHIVGKVSKEVGRVAKLISQSILKSFSVSFIPKEAEYDKATDIFKITELELLEISVVSIPANQDSTFSIRKSIENEKFDFNQFIKQAEPTAPTAPVELAVPPQPEVIEKKQATVPSVVENEEIKNMSQVSTTEGSEKLLQELSDRLAKQEGSFTKAIEDLRGELKEKQAELIALQKSKMEFKAPSEPVSNDMIAKAVLLSKVTGKSLQDTKLGREVMQKASSHNHNVANNTDWETVFSNQVIQDVRENLVIAPLFQRSINMPTANMYIAVNPEAGYGEWISTASYFNSSASTGTAVNHTLNEINLVAYKLVTKEYLGYEEEEDNLIPMLPVIQEAMARRMAKSWDKAILRGAGAAGDPILGICADAAAISGATTSVTASSEVVTVAKLIELRRSLGIYGLDPRELVYVVSKEIYYDLLEDDDWRVMDKVGANNATYLTGQVGDLAGSPVIVSGEFAAKGAGAYGACVVRPSSWIVGTTRGLTVERDKDIEYQRNILVASRRIAFKRTTPAATANSAVLVYV